MIFFCTSKKDFCAMLNDTLSFCWRSCHESFKSAFEWIFKCSFLLRTKFSLIPTRWNDCVLEDWSFGVGIKILQDISWEEQQSDWSSKFHGFIPRQDVDLFIERLVFIHYPWFARAWNCYKLIYNSLKWDKLFRYFHNLIVLAKFQASILS